jgi:hypothetical protein
MLLQPSAFKHKQCIDSAINSRCLPTVRVLCCRRQLSQELDSITTSAARLSSRAASLGSGLASLQGCMTVLQGSRGGRLAPASKLGVLQLVLGEVVGRLPGERLRELPVCQGLPALDAAGQQLCSAAGAGGPAGAAAEPGSSAGGGVQVSSAGVGAQQPEQV